MSLPVIHFGIRRPKPKHRAVDKVGQLQQQLNDQQAELSRAFGQLIGAKDHIALLEQDLTEARSKQAEAEQVVVCLDADLVERNAEVAVLRARLAPYLAADANRNAITVPPAERDTTAMEDQATAPIDVKPLWEAHGISPVIRIADAPSATDPRTPTWVPAQAEPDSETTHTFRVVAA